MTGEMFLFILSSITIVIILLMGIFQTYSFIGLKRYRTYWEPIYKNRIDHFDKYLKEAIKHREMHESVYDVASYAAYLNYENENINIDEKINKNTYISKKKDEYVHELRCAGFE